MFNMTFLSLQVSRWKDHTRTEFIFTRGFGHVSEAAFAMCGNPTKYFSSGNSPQLNFRFTSVLSTTKKEFFH